MSITLPPPAGFNASQLVFSDDFSGSSLNINSWNTYMTSNAAGGWAWSDNGLGGSGLGPTFDAEYNMPSQVSVNKGLTLAAIKNSITANGTTYPYTSGVISSYGKLEFTGGYLQISMKAPSGNGAWPALWMLPGSGAGNSGDNFEIDIQEGGFTGTGNPNNAMAYHLHTPDGNLYGGQVDTGIDLTSSFNTYAINWIPGQSITWYLNGAVIGKLTSAQCAIPNEPMELIISNEVANAASSGWHTALNSSTPASLSMQVADVQLYQASGLGESVLGRNVTATAAPAAPTVAITSQGATVTAAAQTISGTVDVADAGSTVTILDGTTKIGSAVVAANGTWSANVTLTSPGANVLTATDTNASGKGVSNAVTFNLTSAAAAPTVAITSQGATVSAKNQTISGTVDVADAGSTVTILDGTTKIGSAVVAANGTWSTNVTLTSPGANVLTATDTNASGKGVSNAVTYNVIVASTPTIAPTVTIANTSKWTALANQTIHGAVDVADAGSTVEIYDGRTRIGAATVAADGSWSANVTLTHLGANVLTATDTNASGKGVSNAVTLNLSSGTPKLKITSAGGTTALADQTITGTANLANTYVGSTVHILDGKTEIGTATVAANGVWSANVTLANQGANVLTATDANDNGTGVSNRVTFNLAAGVSSAAVAAPLSAASASSSSLVTNSVAQSAVVSDASTASPATTAKVALLNQFAASGFENEWSGAPSIAGVIAHNASQHSFLASPRH